MNPGTLVNVVVVFTVFAIAIVASGEATTPEDLPDVALGWNVLFHVERAAAFLGATGIVLLIGWRATQGEFPIKFGNVEYAAKEAAAEARVASAAQERRIQYLEVLAGVRPMEDLEADEDQA